MTESKPIPRWILYYGYLLTVATIGFGAMFYINSNPTVAQDLGFLVGNRNLATFAILLLGVLTKDAKFLLSGYLLRLIADLGDALNSIFANEMTGALMIFVIFTIPCAIGAWMLWGIAKENS